MGDIFIINPKVNRTIRSNLTGLINAVMIDRNIKKLLIAMKLDPHDLKKMYCDPRIQLSHNYIKKHWDEHSIKGWSILRGDFAVMAVPHTVWIDPRSKRYINIINGIGCFIQDNTRLKSQYLYWKK